MKLEAKACDKKHNASTTTITTTTTTTTNGNQIHNMESTAFCSLQTEWLR